MNAQANEKIYNWPLFLVFGPNIIPSVIEGWNRQVTVENVKICFTSKIKTFTLEATGKQQHFKKYHK